MVLEALPKLASNWLRRQRLQVVWRRTSWKCMSAPPGAVNSWGQGTSAKAVARRIKRAAPTASVKREAGPLAKKPKGKSDGKGGKSKGARHTVDQAEVQLCFSWNFGGSTWQGSVRRLD